MPRWLENRTLGTVYWLEAPAIYLMFVMFGYGLQAVLTSQGVDQVILKNIHLAIIGVGIMLGSSYIWLVSKNTSKQIFTFLARGSVLLYISMFIFTLVWHLK